MPSEDAIWLTKKRVKLSVVGLRKSDVDQLRRFADALRKRGQTQDGNQLPPTLPPPPANNQQPPPAPSASKRKAPPTPPNEASSDGSRPPEPPPDAAPRQLRSANARPAPMEVSEQQDAEAGAAHEPAAVPNPPDNRVVIFDNISNLSRKELEPELYRCAPWLQPISVDVMRSGGLRVKCSSVTDADRLLKRDGFPANAFHGRFVVHHKGALDVNQPLSKQLERDMRSIITGRIPAHYDAADLRTMLLPDYVESIRDLPKKDPYRPPLRVIVMKTMALRDDALENGLKFMNRRVKARPLRNPVLPAFCRRCSGLGHTAVDCQSAVEICAKCTGNHRAETCSVQKEHGLCPNCPDATKPHFATYRGCPAYREAAAKEAEFRTTRLAAKKAKTERRKKNQYARPDRPPPALSGKPAPIRQGTSYAAASASTLAAATATAPVTTPPVHAATAPPAPASATPATSAPVANVTNVQDELMRLLQSIQLEVRALRTQQIDLATTVTRLQERIDVVPTYDSDSDDDSDVYVAMEDDQPQQARQPQQQQSRRQQQRQRQQQQRPNQRQQQTQPARRHNGPTTASDFLLHDVSS